MKIAFCLSGHLRTYDKAIESFNNFKSFIGKIGNIDIFISTWEHENNIKDSLHQSGNEEKIINLEKIKNYYNPLSITTFDYSKIEEYLKENYFKPKYDYESFGPRYSKYNIPHHMRGYFLLLQVAKLKENTEEMNNFKYDIVFRIRPDYFFNKEIYEKIPFKNLINNTFYSFMYRYNDVDDQFGFSDSKTFSKYSKTFFHLDEIGKTWEHAYDVPRTSSYGHPEMITYFNSRIEEFDFNPIARVGEIIR
jgi:hypothetical protein